MFARLCCTATAVAGLVLVTAAPLSAQDSDGPPSTYCLDEAPFGQFDFWLGTWDVYQNGTDILAGENTIEKSEGGCLITERWTGVSGTTGFSTNYYNPIDGKWRQIWVANGYSIDFSGGLNDGGAMRLEGDLYTYGQNTAAPFRGTWTPNDDGTVRQLFELYDFDAKKWQVWFDGLYKKRIEPTTGMRKQENGQNE